MKVRRSIWISAALVIAASLILIVVFNVPDKGITFHDANLEAMVRDQVGKPSGSIQRADIEKIDALDINYDAATVSLNNTTYSGAVRDLTDLRHFTALEVLMISGAEIETLSPLSSLSDLQAAFFIDCNITAGFAPLSDLPNLQCLVIRESQVSDLASLGNMTKLSELWLMDIGGAGIGNLSAISHLTNLNELTLVGNNIHDLSPLANLTELTGLAVSNNEISDITPLSQLTNMTRLDLINNQISDISPLSKLTNLTSLSLDYNQISDIAPLSGLANLTSLGLSDNQISDISPLVENSREGNGTFISLGNNPLNEVSMNVYLPQLRAMGFSVQL